MAEKRQYAISKFENNVDYIPEYVEGEFDIPFIKPEPYDGTVTFMPFNVARSLQYKRERYGIHFFIHDYMFTNLWTQREKYKRMLPEFKAVMTPDFSPYYDWPVMVQRWNHYRKHLLGAWMQEIGCKVYPTITWSDAKSLKWCFDGEPYKATVCVSSVGTQKKKFDKALFMRGYDRMMEVLEPETILFYGPIPKECEGNIVPIETFQKKFKKGREQDDQDKLADVCEDII